jgi:selenide,water dikinase
MSNRRWRHGPPQPARGAGGHRHGAHAVTDVTGYSLLGHAHEIADLSRVDLELDLDGIRWLPGARRYAADWIFPGGMSSNRAYYSQWVTFAEGISEDVASLLYDRRPPAGC